MRRLRKRVAYFDKFAPRRRFAETVFLKNILVVIYDIGHAFERQRKQFGLSARRWIVITAEFYEFVLDIVHIIGMGERLHIRVRPLHHIRHFGSKNVQIAALYPGSENVVVTVCVHRLVVYFFDLGIFR